MDSSPGGTAGQNASIKRGYVACIPCRVRKVRCIIEDEPPCVKCRREYRQCQFSSRPKGSKQREPPKWAKSSMTTGTPGSSITTPASISSGSPTKTANTPGNFSVQDATEPNQFIESRPVTVDIQPGLQNPSGSLTDASLSSRVLSTVVTGTDDALMILSDAVHQQHHSTVERCIPSDSEQDRPSAIPTYQMLGGGYGMGFSILTLSEPEEDILDLWEKCKFVIQAWFTAQEAVTYIDLFFKYLSPCSPIIVGQFSQHDSHYQLIREESLLCCTILMISSRFFMLPGPGGASRSQLIHERLWTYCELLIRRVMIGHETLSADKIRTVGCIESLMLISDWHPRALHFPALFGGGEGLLIPSQEDSKARKRARDEAQPIFRWRDDVFEPAKRANRMSWMMLGMATNLAHEIGIFSINAENTQDLSGLELRGLRARRTLYAYVTHTAIRLGYQPNFPESALISVPHSAESDTVQHSHHQWNIYLDLWIGIIKLSKTASSLFFRSPEQLHSHILNDNYHDLLEHFDASLMIWRTQFDSRCHEINTDLKNSLLLEFHHLRSCAMAIAIQAVVTRATRTGLGSQHDSFSLYITPKDAKCIHNVIYDGQKVLQIATIKSFRTRFPFAPTRVRIRVISASVFLLKAISVGSTETDIQATLQMLDQSAATLKSSPQDDMDFVLRYVSLVEDHTAHFRANLMEPRPSRGNAEDARDRSYSAPGTEIPIHESGVSEYPSNPELELFPGTDLEELTNFGNFSGEGGDGWRGLPFDTNIAPFNSGRDQLSLGLDVDSLNFLWNLADQEY